MASTPGDLMSSHAHCRLYPRKSNSWPNAATHNSAARTSSAGSSCPQSQRTVSESRATTPMIAATIRYIAPKMAAPFTICFAEMVRNGVMLDRHERWWYRSIAQGSKIAMGRNPIRAARNPSHGHGAWSLVAAACNRPSGSLVRATSMVPQMTILTSASEAIPHISPAHRLTRR